MATLPRPSFSHGDCNPSINHPLTPINYDLYQYHHTDELIKEVKDLVGRHPDELTLETWETGNKGYLAEIFVVTYRSGGQESEDDGKYRVLLSFGQHVRELITSEVALRLLKILSGEHEMPQLFSLSMNHTLKNLVIKVIPMENLNGRKFVEGGSYCERRNGRGVDINRNWSVDWGKKEKDYDPFEENPGIAPFSEPESQIMRKLGASFNPHIWVNVHSGMEALFMPYDHKNTTPDGHASQTMKPLLDEINHLHCQDRCTVGSGGGSVGYFAHGTATDYIYDIIKVPIVFTFEFVQVLLSSEIHFGCQRTKDVEAVELLEQLPALQVCNNSYPGFSLVSHKEQLLTISSSN